MMNGAKLESFYSMPHGGAECFFSDLLSEYNPDDQYRGDITYLLDLTDDLGVDLPRLGWMLKSTISLKVKAKSVRLAAARALPF